MSHRYIFDDSMKALPGTTKPQLAPHVLVPGHPTEVGGVPVLPLGFPHGHLTVLGFRFGDLASSCAGSSSWC